MQLCICARTTSGVTAIPQSTTVTTRSTLTEPSVTVTSTTCATTVPNDSWTATPRPRNEPLAAFPVGKGLSHPAFCAASFNAAALRGCLSSIDRRYATGSLPAAAANSSATTSFTNAVCVWPTDRHHKIGTPTFAWVQVTCAFSTSYCSVVPP